MSDITEDDIRQLIDSLPKTKETVIVIGDCLENAKVYKKRETNMDNKNLKDWEKNLELQLIYEAWDRAFDSLLDIETKGGIEFMTLMYMKETGLKPSEICLNTKLNKKGKPIKYWLSSLEADKTKAKENLADINEYEIKIFGNNGSFVTKSIGELRHILLVAEQDSKIKGV